MAKVKKAFFILVIVTGFVNVPFIVSANAYFMIRPATGDTLDKYAYHKVIPVEFRMPILKALTYFPELKNVHIRFVIKPAYTPLTTKPSFSSIFKTKNSRTYIVTISNRTIDTLSPLLFKNLTFDEKVGIMGHELSHVVDFDSKNLFQTIGNGAGHISGRFLDKMEYNTDLICLQHGLGKYLEQYSMHVRKTMHVHYWRGVDHVFEKDDHIERYMNPATIERYMHQTSASTGNNNKK
jgi:hypothetical protein